MSINTAHYPKGCYGNRGHGLESEVPKPSRVVFTEFLAGKLQKRGIAAKLAAHCGVKEATISRWKDGLAEPSFEQKDRIAEFFEVPVSSLFKDPTDARSTEIDHETAWRMLGELLPKGRNAKD